MCGVFCLIKQGEKSSAPAKAVAFCSAKHYVRHETHYSQEVMSEKLGLTRKKYRKYEKEIMYPDADTDRKSVV